MARIRTGAIVVGNALHGTTIPVEGRLTFTFHGDDQSETRRTSTSLLKQCPDHLLIEVRSVLREIDQCRLLKFSIQQRNLREELIE